MEALPIEILCDIFLLSLPHNGISSLNEIPFISSNESILTPLNISHVCRTWRNVALAYGELWSYLRIRFDNRCWKFKTQRNRYLNIIDTWLSRTNDSPINFVVHCSLNCHGCEMDDEAYSDAERIVISLVEHQNRWKDVYFYWRCVKISRETSRRLALDNMPMLTSLCM